MYIHYVHPELGIIHFRFRPRMGANFITLKIFETIDYRFGLEKLIFVFEKNLYLKNVLLTNYIFIISF